jgi:pilus assembly protein CpaC
MQHVEERGRNMGALRKAVHLALALLVLSPAGMAASGAASSANADAQAPASPAVPQPTQAALAPETQSLHIEVGRSIVMNVQNRLRRIVVSNNNILETATVSPTQVVVTAKAPGTSSLVLWDENSNARILDVFADIDVSGLRDGVRSAYPDQSVQVEADQGRVLLSGHVADKASADDIVHMAAVYSKEVLDGLVIEPPAHVKQVMLKVRFAEVDRIKLQQFGFNILSTGAANTIGTTGTGQFGQPSLGGTLTGAIGSNVQGATSSLGISNLLNIFLFRPDLNLGATIEDLQQKNIMQILAEPNLMARSGETAKFLAGGEFPFPVVQGGVGGTAASVTIMFKPYGVKLEFTATIIGNVVRLKVMPEVSTLDYSNAVQISGYEIPAISTRRAETEVELRDGQSFGIAGLLDKRTTAQMSKLPGLADIPVLGNLFRSKSFSQTNSELLVMVTPEIVDPVMQQNVTPPPTPAMPVHPMENKKFDHAIDDKLYPASSLPANDK